MKDYVTISMAIFLVISVMIGCSGISQRVELDPESELFYQMVNFWMTRKEKNIFFSLSTIKLRKEFIREFWEIRDPEPASDENEFKEMIEDRFEYVNKYFREGSNPGWKTDRGRIFMILGNPNAQDYSVMTNLPQYQGIVYWYYMDPKGLPFFIVFVDREGHGRYFINIMMSSAHFSRVVEKVKREQIILEKEDKRLKMGELEFDINYHPDSKELSISIASNQLVFEGEESDLVAKIKIDFMFYHKGKRYVKKTETKTVNLTKKELLQLEKPFKFMFPVDLKPGRNIIDITITDEFNNSRKRETKVVKIH